MKNGWARQLTSCRLSNVLLGNYNDNNCFSSARHNALVFSAEAHPMRSIGRQRRKIILIPRLGQMNKKPKTLNGRTLHLLHRPLPVNNLNIESPAARPKRRQNIFFEKLKLNRIINCRIVDVFFDVNVDTTRGWWNCHALTPPRRPEGHERTMAVGFGSGYAIRGYGLLTLQLHRMWP